MYHIVLDIFSFFCFAILLRYKSDVYNFKLTIIFQKNDAAIDFRGYTLN